MFSFPGFIKRLETTEKEKKKQQLVFGITPLKGNQFSQTESATKKKKKTHKTILACVFLPGD